MTNEQKSYWMQQAEWAVKTVGVSGVILGVLLWGGYRVVMRCLDLVEPKLERVTEAHIKYLATETENGRKNQQNLEKLIDINGQVVELVKGVHERLDTLEEKLEDQP